MDRFGYRNRRRHTIICMSLALALAFLLTGWLVKERGLLVEAKMEKAQQNLAGEVLRFHVLADSDSEEDQRVKMQVKEAVLAYLEKEMPDEGGGFSLESTKSWVEGHLKDIEAVAVKTAREAGSRDRVEAKLETASFPKKTYGDVTFPAGEYEALRIKIGKASGQNWWCCLYPNLCFTDAVHAVVPEEEKKELKEVLDEDAYEMVTCTTDFKIKWFFFMP